MTVLLVALAGLMAMAPLSPTASGAYLSRLTDTTDTAATNTYFTCRAAAVGETGTRAYFSYPLSETSGTTVADVSGNGRTGLYTSTGVAYGQAGPCPRDSPAGRAITLNGSTGYVSGPNSTQTNLNTFSVEIWFRTATAGGKLIGWGNVRTGSSSQYDRQLYIDSTGLLEFGVYPNAVKTIASPDRVTDGAWHQAIGTLSPAGQFLYLDGQLVASNTTVTTGQAGTGYWRIGYDNLSAWTNQPTNYFFTGSLAWASVYTYALTPAQAASHYVAGT